MSDARSANGAALRATAARVLARVMEGRSLSDLLPEARRGLISRDQALLAELVQGTCRWFHRLDFLADMLLERPFKARDRELQALLLVGLYQLTFTRIPPHAAVNETAQATRRLHRRWAAGLVNAVLRRFQRERARLEEAALREPTARYSQPAWFIEAMQRSWPDQADAILSGLLERPPFILRVDLQRTTREEQAARLARVGIACRPVQGVPSALRLDRAVPVSRLPGFDQGLVSVQDAGAQLAAPLLDLRPGMRVLDACAAPGGKTGHLLEQAPDLSLVAVDADPVRLERVEENLARLGRSAELWVGDAANPAPPWGGRRYHRILADVPCTATGVMRRHPDIRLLRRPQDLSELVERQRRILDALWRLLLPGGKLLYATCSLLPEENEAQVSAFLARQQDARALPLVGPPGLATGHGLQLLPLTRETDGFYYALLEKKGG